MAPENKSSSLRESHVRLGTREHGAWIPLEWESEARAVLYALRKEHAPFVKMPSFNNGTLNPLHALTPSDLRSLAKANPTRAPWHERDVDVTITVAGTMMGREVVPIIFLKMNEPMVHVAAVTYLSTLTKWTFGLSLEGELFIAEFRSHKGERVWGVSTPALRDDDSMLIRRYLAARGEGILSLPLTTRLYDEMQPEKALTEASLGDCQNFFFGEKKKVQSLPKAEGAKTRIVPREKLLAMVG
jgi:hypothetical protein